MKVVRDARADVNPGVDSGVESMTPATPPSGGFCVPYVTNSSHPATYDPMSKAAGVLIALIIVGVAVTTRGHSTRTLCPSTPTPAHRTTSAGH